jgi:hypothetical protein
MAFGYVSGATPVVESATLVLNLQNFLEVAPLKFGAGYPHVIFFHCEFFGIFEDILSPFKYSANLYFQSNF